jgi:hypothetical protein
MQKIKKPKADRYEYIGCSQIPHSYLPTPSIVTWFVMGHGLAWRGLDTNPLTWIKASSLA